MDFPLYLKLPKAGSHLTLSVNMQFATAANPGKYTFAIYVSAGHLDGARQGGGFQSQAFTSVVDCIATGYLKVAKVLVTESWPP